MNFNNTKHYVGIDVSKETLEICIRPTGEAFTVNNKKLDIERLIRQLQTLKPERIVMEATGGFESLTADMLKKAGMPVVVINANRVRGFAKALGKLAKTDSIDADVIAHFAEAVCPEIRQLPDENSQELADLITRRSQLSNMLTSEKNRLPRMKGKAQENVKHVIEMINQEIKDVDKQILNLLQSDPDWKTKNEILQSIPGIGKTISGVLVAQLPELGQLNNKQISALVGLAPFNNDSGKCKGTRHVYGGRASVRSQLYMGALTAIRHNPAIKEFYNRLLSVGKPKKAALTACSRKLLTIANSMIKNNTSWDENYAKSS